MKIWKLVEAPDNLVAYTTDGHFTLEVYEDLEPENPREWENVGKMIIWKENLENKDNKTYADIISKYYNDIVILYTLKVEIWHTGETEISIDEDLTSELEKYVKTKDEKIYEKLLNKNPDGIYYVLKSALDEYGSIKEIKKFINEEIELYNMYRNGEVYYYVLKQITEKGDDKEISKVGFYARDFDSFKTEIENLIGPNYHELIEKLEKVNY